MTPPPSAIARARAMRRALTPPEASLWLALRRLRAEGHHFRRQTPFRGYFLDFVCYAQRLVVEVDGAQHGTEAQARHDAVRDAVLAREGFRTLRVAATDVLRNLEGVVTAIRLTLSEPRTLAASPPVPLHEGLPPLGASPPVFPREGFPPPGASRHPPHKGEGEGRA